MSPETCSARVRSRVACGVSKLACTPTQPTVSSMDGKQFVTITAYETELAKIITVPAHYSLDQIREAIWAEMDDCPGSPNRHHSSIVIAPGEITHSSNPKCSGENEANSPEGDLFNAIIYVKPDVAVQG